MRALLLGPDGEHPPGARFRRSSATWSASTTAFGAPSRTAPTARTLSSATARGWACRARSPRREPALSLALPAQHARLPDGARSEPGSPRDARRLPDAEIDRLAATRLRLGLAAERVEHREGEPAGLAVVARAARGVRGDAAGPPGGRHRGLGLRDHRLLGAPGARRRRGARAAPRSPRRARPQADARLRSQTTRRSTIPGWKTIRSTTWAGRSWTCARAPQLHVGETQARRPRDGLRARPVLRRAGRTRCSSTTRNPATREAMVGGAAEDRAGNATACAATWRCWCCRRSSSGPGAVGPSCSGRRPSRRVRESSPGLPASWPRSTGTSSGRCSSRASTTPTTSGSTTACARARRGPSREHLQAGLDYQDRLARFLENHDEPRAAASFTPEAHKAAAVTTFLSPGLRFFHAGQLEGRRKKISPHLVRAPVEPVDRELAAFYEQLLGVLRRPACGDGRWQLLEFMNAWDGNPSSDGFVAFAWELGRERLIVAVNRRRPRPMPGAPAVHGPGGPLVAAAGRARPGRLRPRRLGAADARALPRRAGVARLGLLR